MVNTISFPGLGISAFEINRVAFYAGPFTVYWYGVIICVGILLGLSYMYFRLKGYGMTGDDLTDIALVTVPCAIVGARVYYVLTSLDEFSSFYDMIAIWNGGIAIYGAVIAGALAIYFVSRAKKLPVLKVFDSAAPAVMLGQIIGRWGNFVNAEAFGGAEKYEFFGKVFDISHFSQVNIFRMEINGVTVHPTFLYESVWNLLGFVLINVFYKKKSFDGEILLWYLTWYGFGRCFIEGFRTDSLFVGNIRISQLVGLLCFVFGLALTLFFAFRAGKNKAPLDGGDGK